jgi:hypothetical protein
MECVQHGNYVAQHLLYRRADDAQELVGLAKSVRRNFKNIRHHEHARPTSSCNRPFRPEKSNFGWFLSAPRWFGGLPDGRRAVCGASSRTLNEPPKPKSDSLPARPNAQ